MEPLHVGLIADADGVQYVAAALSDPSLHVVAQSGMRQNEGLPSVEWIDDARAMIAQAGVQALVLATSPRVAFELDSVIADRGLPLWRLPPLARNFAEATELVTRIRQRATPYRVASWWEAIAEDARWALRSREGFKPLFTAVHVRTTGPPLQSWRSSQVDAPGGVLATDAYAMLEALVAVRKLPERVFASIANVRRRPSEAPRETESVAVLVLRYEAGAIASVEASWDIPPYLQSTAHHGVDTTIALEPDRVAILDGDGGLREERRLAPDAFLRDEIQRFAAAVRHTGAAPEPAGSLERHVAVTALLEAAYLSARTGQPESPRKFYEVQGWPEPRP